MSDIIIRKAEAEDAERLLEIYAPYVKNTAITFEYEVPSVSEFETRIRNTLIKYPYITAVCDGRIVGYAYAGGFKARQAYDWAVETSIYIDKDYRRSHIGSMLYARLEEILKKMNIVNLEACIAYPHEKEDEYLTRDSVSFHESQGYRMAGSFEGCGYKFGRWYDMVWMEKIIGEHKTCMPAVVWFNNGETE